MLHRSGHLPAFACLSILIAGWGIAHAAPVSVDIRAGTLQDALSELAREGGVDILYTADLVRGLRGQAVKGRLSSERALAQLLAGSGIDYRITPDGVFVLFLKPARPLDPGDGAISEVLVLGRPTQNTDIRRSENDIQPYKVMGARDLRFAAQDNVGQYLRERLPSDGQVVSPAQQVAGSGATTSAIDVRGIGQQRTLVLIDGRRMPGIPTLRLGLAQSDINALPLGAIERIETLTSTAGGIHGPTALGGVVNIVLKRDYQGADLTVASGLTSRGDAGRARIEGRIGLSPDGGATSIMLAGSYTAAQRLTVGQRNYARRSLERQARYNPDGYLVQARPVNAITVRSVGGDALRLDDGTALNSYFSFLPLDFQGAASARNAVLAANAGQLPTTPPKGLAGDDTTLVATPSTRSIFFSVRRPIGSRFELFADGWSLYNKGEATFPKDSGQYRTAVVADAPTNPFANPIYINFPSAGLVDVKSVDTNTRRVTTGLIATLPGRWRISTEYTIGRTSQVIDSEGSVLATTFLQPYLNGVVGPQGQAPMPPFGGFANLEAAVLTYAVPSYEHYRLKTQFSSGVVRAAGPVVDLPQGPLTATLLVEARRERMPSANRAQGGAGGPGRDFTPDRVQFVKSGYAEIRAPLLGRQAPIAPARGLELQLAVRRDDVRTTFPDMAYTGAAMVRTRATTHHDANVFTIGLRSFPLERVMVRASLATGETPPDMSQLQELGIVVTSAGLKDPRRGGRLVTADGPFLWGRTGRHDVGQERGLTQSVGLVFNPSEGDGPRLSIDVSRVDIRDEIGNLNLGYQEVVNDEARYGDQVKREPLSAADAALGYTGGRILAVYTGASNVGRTVAETVDLQLDWRAPRLWGGETQVYGAATWQPTLRTRRRPDANWLNRVGYRDGPLRWRGNAGVQWTRGATALDLNAQYLGRSSPLWSPYNGTIQTTAKNQGRSYIPSRVYFDLAVRRQFAFSASQALRTLEMQLAVQNLLDTSPPIVADPSQMGYDYRSDPRRRRFELSLSGRF